MRRKPTPENIKETVLAMHDEDYSYREIAREVGVDHSTVGRIIRKANRPTNTAQTQEANAARKARMNQKRLDHAEMLMEQLNDMQSRIWDRYEVIVNSPDGAEHMTLSEPPLKEQADGYRAIQSIANTIDTLLDSTDTESTTQNAKNLLTDILTGFKAISDLNKDIDLGEGSYTSDYDINKDPEQNK